MSKKVLVLPGDGIGQEVTASAVEVLDFITDEIEKGKIIGYWEEFLQFR